MKLLDWIILKIKKDVKRRCQYAKSVSILFNKKHLSEKEKSKKRQYGHEQGKNLSEHEKQKLVYYMKIYSPVGTNKTASQIKLD